MLEVGDIFEITEGMLIKVHIPSCFNHREHSTHDVIKVGEVRRCQDRKFDTRRYLGDYVVVNTDNNSGSYDMPDAYYIKAKKLDKNGNSHRSGVHIEFYQTGKFHQTNVGIEKKDKKKLH